MNQETKSNTSIFSEVFSGCSLYVRLLLTSLVLAPISSRSADLESGAQKQLSYPSANRGSVVDDYFGTKVSDPYRWLESLDSEETRNWVTAEAKLTDSYLANSQVRQSLKERLKTLLNFEKYGVPFQAGGHYFYTHNSGLQQQSVLYTTAGLAGKPTRAFNPNLLAGNNGAAASGYVPSPDGMKLAYGVSQGGSDWTEWRVRDLITDKDLPGVVRWTKYYHPVFSPDGKGFYYSGFPAPTPGEELRARDLGNAIYYHAIGTEQSSDQKIHTDSSHMDWQYAPHLSRHSNWLVITAGEGEVGDKGLENVYALNLKEPKNAIVTLVEGFDAAYLYVGSEDGWLYFQTTLNAPRGRIIGINPNSPERTKWKEIIPSGPDAMESGGSVTMVHHQFVVRTLHDAHTEVTTYDLTGKLQHRISMPGQGTASGFGGDINDKETFYSYTDFVTPATIYRLDLDSGKSEIYRTSKAAFKTGNLESKQVFYSGKDGTRIPMYLVHQKGLVLDGHNPTLLYGYGGFGNSVLPRFDAARLLWLERGGVFAVANLRGGGEYGEEWHRQAIRSHKQIVFDDFIAAAEWLIANHYTTTNKLAIEGGSNGGLLVGACVTQRPDLFGAALAYVGVMDMLRFDLFGQGAGWVGDYGSPRNPEDFKALFAYSPYHNVRAGTHYPATFVVTGDHDARVMPAHSFKFAAALQAAQSGPSPVLLRVRLATGHGAGPTTSQFIDEKADAYTFLMENLGMTRKATME